MKIDISKYKDIKLEKYGFCEFCGKKLILRNVSVEEYNCHTGNPKIRLDWGCPNYKWWQRFCPSLAHTLYETYERGE